MTTNPFDHVCRIVNTCAGYTLDAMHLSIIAESADDLQIGLRWGPDRPDVTLALREIHHLNLSREPRAPALLDRLTATPLMPADGPWPPGLGIDTLRTAELPPLLWICCPGPLRLDVVCAVATVLTEDR